MKLDEFIEFQRPIIEAHGLEQFAPTLWVDAADLEITILANPPEDPGEVEETARDWALRNAREYNYFLAFPRDLTSLQVVARLEGVMVECVVPFEPTEPAAE